MLPIRVAPSYGTADLQVGIATRPGREMRAVERPDGAAGYGGPSANRSRRPFLCPDSGWGAPFGNRRFAADGKWRTPFVSSGGR